MSDSNNIIESQESHEGNDAHVPVGVVHRKSYDAYMVKVAELDSSELQEYSTSNPALVIDLLADRYTVAKAIRGLPEQEQDDIIAKHGKVIKLRTSAARLRAKAYGKTGRGKLSAVGVIPKAKQAEILEYFGRYFTIGEVLEIVTHKWGFRDITKKTLQTYRKAHIEIIKQRQEEYKRDFSDIRLGYKRGRIEELVYLYRTRKTIYDNGTHRDDSKEMRAILEQLRKEVEGDKLTIDANFNIQQDSQIEMHVYNQLMTSLAIKSIVISRVAARLGVSADMLLERMYRSYYAKFTGFTDPQRETSEDAKILYPSQVMYEFSSLKEKSDGMRLTGSGVIADAEIIGEERIEKASGAKEKLMAMLFSDKESGSMKDDDGRGRERSLD